MNQDPVDQGPPRGLAFGGTIFLEQSAHVAILDGAGRIMAVNAAWERFGRANGLDPSYGFAGVDYLDVCDRAVTNARSCGVSCEGATEALAGLRAVLDAAAPRFSLTYPCHAPHERRWFLMFARPLSSGVRGAVVSHIDVTALKLAGLVPDETEKGGPTRESPARGAAPDAARVAALRACATIGACPRR